MRWKEEQVTAAIPVKTFNKNQFLVMATRTGKVKKVSLDEFENIRRTGIIAIGLKEDDELGWVKETDGKQEIIISTMNGLLIRFKEGGVRPMGRTAAGVKGITLRKGDAVVSMDIVAKNMDLLEVSQGGYGKRMDINEFRTQGRGGKGLTAMKVRKGDVVARARFIEEDDELLFVTAKGTISRQKAKGISRQGRYAMGVRIQRLDKDDYIVDVARMVKGEEKPE